MASAAETLAQRLRSLRTASWPDIKVTQPQLARALRVSVPLISSWESATQPKVPPVLRLEAYATLFCTPRSLQQGELRLLDRLNADERATQELLRKELLSLRRAALRQPEPPEEPVEFGHDFWHFPDRNPITLICAKLPDDLLARMPYVHFDDPDYIELYTYADLDALFELHGHVRAVNPGSEVRRRHTKEIQPDDLTTHLVLLGGIDWNDVTTELLEHLGPPVEQVSNWDDDDGVYFSAGGRQFAPRLLEGRLQEDVALFFRGPNPLNRERSLTICNGMYGRGTLGAVRALTDRRFRDRNAAYLRERFGDPTYAVLTRVAVLNGAVVTPDWSQEESRLYEWPHEPPD